MSTLPQQNDIGKLTKTQIDNLYTILEKSGRLYNADVKLCSHTCDLCQHFHCHLLPSLPKFMSGSSRTGGALARWFSHCGSTLMEWDLMYHIARIYCSCKGTVDDLPAYPGFAKVRSIDMSGRGYCSFNANDNEFRDCLHGNTYINGEGVKDKLQGCLEKWMDQPTNKTSLEKAFKKIFGRHDLHLSAPYFEKDGVSIKFTLVSDQKPDVVFECDNIASIHCEIYWPTEASTWKDVFTNEIHYANDYKPVLTGNQARSIQHGGCHIIPKTIPDSLGSSWEEKHNSWRWSVSFAEAAVQDLFSAEQDLAYFMVKVLFYHHKKESKLHEHFTSFFIKNIAFNTFAKTYGRKDEAKSGGIDESCFDWDEAIQMMYVLIQVIIICFIKNDLPHFFMKRYNLMSTIPQEARSKVIETFTNLSEDFLKATITFPCSSIDDIIKRVDDLCTRSESYEKNYPCCAKAKRVKIGLKQLEIQDVGMRVNLLYKIKSMRETFKSQRADITEIYDLKEKIKQSRSSVSERKRLQEKLENLPTTVYLLSNGRSLRIGEKIEILQDEEQDHGISALRSRNNEANKMVEMMKQNMNASTITEPFEMIQRNDAKIISDFEFEMLPHVTKDPYFCVRYTKPIEA